MPRPISFQLARRDDATAIAVMSRDLIEAGLGWGWRPERVARQIRCRDSVVLVARARNGIAGFGIMHFAREVAHLSLFAVATSHRRRGIGIGLLRWLEQSAVVAGIATIELEVRAGNRAGRDFYRRAGYEDIKLISGYYRGLESALRMARFLRLSEATHALLNQRCDKTPVLRQLK